ncbi:hypothetical protein HYU11_03470 [Candidatus Woesearchaeota archaeon]|nr:hypothetical protein [Candidatus Woesearchaeota archaeon]
MNNINTFFLKYGIYVLAGIIALGVFAAFFLKAENLVARSCTVQGFICENPEVSVQQSSLAIQLTSEKGIMVKRITATGNGIACTSSYDDGWGPFANGKHTNPNTRTIMSADCTGLKESMVNSGNIRLSLSIDWFPDDSSEAYSTTSKGNVFVSIGP